MKALKHFIILIAFVAITPHVVFSQGLNDWKMEMMNEPGAFQIEMVNNELIFKFNPETDTLKFIPPNNKTIKKPIVVEIAIRNNNKIVFTSDESHYDKDKTGIILPVSTFHDAIKNTKLPSKPMFKLSLKDKNSVKQYLIFNFR